MKGIVLIGLVSFASLAYAYDPLDPLAPPLGADSGMTVGIPQLAAISQDYEALMPKPYAAPQYIEAPDATRNTLHIYDMGHGELQFHQVYGPEQGGVEYHDYRYTE